MRPRGPDRFPRRPPNASRERLTKWFLMHGRRDKKTGCLEWPGALTTSGYGRVRIEGRNVFLHRFICDAPDGVVVRHRCDNRKCFERSHLEFGTMWDNVQDSITRGGRKDAKGEGAPRSVLKAAQVREIRRSTESYQTLAERYGVSPSAIGSIKTGRTWKHLDGPADAT